jgi:ABC-2 type transport system permease protein
MAKAIDGLWYYVKLGAFHLKIAVMAGLEYPVNLITWMISNPVQWIVGFATIYFVVAEFGTLNGWTYEEIAFLYGLSVLSHGLSVCVFIQTWGMGRNIIQGTFDYMKMRPVNILFQFLFSEFSLVGITDIIPGLCVFFYGCVTVGFSFAGSNALSVLLVLAGGTLIRGSVWLFCGSIGFWTKNRGRYVYLTMELFERTTMYPLTIYPRAIQVVFTYLLPLAFISFIPASELLGKSENAVGLAGLLTFAVGLGMFLFSCAVFNMGIRRYDSAGT